MIDRHLSRLVRPKIGLGLDMSLSVAGDNAAALNPLIIRDRASASIHTRSGDYIIARAS